MTKLFLRSAALAAAALVSLGLFIAPTVQAQEGSEPTAALSAALVKRRTRRGHLWDILKQLGFRCTDIGKPTPLTTSRKCS